jgi:hypothetical protein
MKSIKIMMLCFIMAVTVTAKAQDTELSKSVNTVITNYLALKNALAASDGNSAKDKAKGLLASISQVPEKSMNKEQLALWTKYATKLQFDSRHISEVALVPHQREHFASLSGNLYAVLKGLKLNKVTLYNHYCDMKQQYFISDAAKSKDPYMGMDNCSRVKETLPAVK